MEKWKRDLVDKLEVLQLQSAIKLEKYSPPDLKAELSKIEDDPAQLFKSFSERVLPELRSAHEALIRSELSEETAY